MQYLGSPELEFPAIHITGTNGKTTTVRVLTELLARARAQGRRVHEPAPRARQRAHRRSTASRSPTTRFEEMLYAVSLVQESVGVDPSYFDVVTAAAFRWFADEAVDVAVVEVGMGGTWDATNVVDGEVAVVTNVSVDHVEYLGPTREQIAAEKAGIVKPGATLVLGETDPKIQAIFEARRRRPRVPARRRLRGVAATCSRSAAGSSIIRSPGAEYPDVFLPLHGAHQADNAAIALAAAESFVRRAAPVRGRRRRVRAGEVAGPARGRAPPAARAARRRAQRRRRGSAPRARSTRSSARDRARSWSDCSARRSPARCSPRSASRTSPRTSTPVCSSSAGRRARARSRRRSSSRPRSTSACPRSRIEVADRVEDAVGTALLATPADGQIVITGSLYVVGAARSVLVS